MRGPILVKHNPWEEKQGLYNNELLPLGDILSSFCVFFFSFASSDVKSRCSNEGSRHLQAVEVAAEFLLDRGCFWPVSLAFFSISRTVLKDLGSIHWPLATWTFTRLSNSEGPKDVVGQSVVVCSQPEDYHLFLPSKHVVLICLFVSRMYGQPFFLFMSLDDTLSGM